jgi:hypothetical protein
MSLDKRIVLLRLDGVHQIVGLGPGNASFPPALRWDVGWAKLKIIYPSFVIYQEQEGLPCATDEAMLTPELSPLDPA